VGSHAAKTEGERNARLAVLREISRVAAAERNIQLVSNRLLSAALVQEVAGPLHRSFPELLSIGKNGLDMKHKSIVNVASCIDLATVPTFMRIAVCRPSNIRHQRPGCLASRAVSPILASCGASTHAATQAFFASPVASVKHP